MALDPRTQMAQAQGNNGTQQSLTTPLTSLRPATDMDTQRPMTAKRRQLNALTEALFDPFTTMEEADLDALMQAAKQRTPRKRSRS